MNGKELDLSKIADMISKTAENARDKLENQSDKMYNIGEDMMSSVGDGALSGAKNAAKNIEAAGDIITAKYQKVLDEINKSGKKKGDIESLFATMTQIKRSDLNSFNALKDELKDIKAVFADIGEVKGLDNILKQYGKTADKLKSIDFGFGSAFVARGRVKGDKNTPTNTNANTVIENNKIEDSSKKIIAQNNKVEKSQQKVAQATSNAAQASEKDLNKVIQTQKDWLNYLDCVLNDDNFKSSGKRDATSKLKARTQALIQQRQNPDDSKQYATEMAEVAWQKAYDEAKRQGVADSTLTRYQTDAGMNYERNLGVLQEEKALRAEILGQAEAELATVQRTTTELNAENAELSKQTKIVNSPEDMKKFQEEWGKASKNHAPEDMGKRYGYLMEAVSGDSPTMSAVDALNELIAKEQEWKAEQEAAIEASKRKAEEFQTFVNSVSSVSEYQAALSSSEVVVAEYAKILQSISDGSMTATEGMNAFKAAVEKYNTEIGEAVPSTQQQSAAEQAGAQAATSAAEAHRDAAQAIEQEAAAAEKLSKTQYEKTLNKKDISSVLDESGANSIIFGASTFKQKALKQDIIDFTNASFNDDSQTAAEIYNRICEVLEKNGRGKESTDKSYAKIWDYLKGITVAIPKDMEESFAAEFQDEWKQIKRRYGGNSKFKIKIGSGGSGVDTLYEELKGMFPAAFSDDATTVYDQLRTILQAAQKGKIESKLPNKTTVPLSTEDWGFITQVFAKIEEKAHSLRALYQDINGASSDFAEYSERTANSMERQENASKNVSKNTDVLDEEENAVSPIGAGPDDKNARGIINSSKKPALSATAFNNITNNDELQTAFQSIIQEIEQQSMTLVRSDILDSIDRNGVGTLRFVSDDMNNILVQTWKMIDGQLTLASEKYTSIFKESELFDVENRKKVAQAQAQTLRTQFKSFADDPNYSGIISGVETAANDIFDAASFKKFQTELAAAREALKQLKTEMSSSGSLDPLAAAEKKLNKLPFSIEKIKTEYKSLKEFDTKDIVGAEGVDVESLMQSLQNGMNAFNDSTKSVSKRLSSFKDIIKTFGQLESLMSALRAKATDSNKSFTPILTAYKELLKLQEDQKKAEVSGATDEKKGLISDNIKAKIDQLKQLGIDIEDINKNTNLTTEQRNKLLKEQEESLARIKKIEVDAANSQAQKEKRQSLNYGKGVFNSETKKRDNLVTTYDSINKDSGASAGLTAAMDAYIAKYNEFEKARQKIADPTTDVTKADRDAFNKVKLEVEKAREAVETYTKSYSKLEQAQNDGTLLGMDDTADPAKLQNSVAALKEYGAEISNGKLHVTGFNKTATEMYGTIDRGKGVIDQVTVALESGTGTLYAYRTATKEVGTVWEQFKGSLSRKAKELTSYIVGGGSIYGAINQVRKGISYVKEIDSALTELKKVTDETDETYDQFLKTMSATGAEIGATVSNLTNMAASWARLGYSIKEAGDLAKSTAVLLNVSEFTDADTASEALISTMQAFGYVADDSMHVVDVLNEVGNNYAVSSDGLATALQDSASSLMAAGNTLEQSVAMVAAANKVLQDPSSVGAALRTISLRIRGTSTKVLEEMGEETDGVIESVSKLQAKVKGLSGVNILTDTGGYKDTYTIIKEIAEVWDQMSDIDQAALLELLAGKNRSNAMAALIGNLDDLEGAYETAMDAQGSAEAENEKYLNSIQGKVDQFTNALQTMWTNFIDSSVIKFIVDVGTSLVQLADNIGLVGTAITAVVAKLALTKGFSELKNTINSVKTAFSTAMNAAKGVVSTISSFSGEGLSSFLGGKIETSSISAITQAINAEIAAQGSLNKELAKQILLNNGVKEENIEGALAAMGYTSANGTLSFSFKALGVSIKEAAVAFWASPFGKVAIIAAVIGGIVWALDQLITTHDEYVDKLKETSDEISDVKSDIESLNNELKTTQERIDELNSKDKLSFTEKEELKNLKAQNAELERSIRLKEQKEERLQKKAARQLNDAVKTDWSVFGNTQVYKNAKGEYVSASEAIDVNSNNYAVNGDPLKEGYSREAVSIIQSKIIEYQRAQKELNEAKDELENIGDDATDKQVKAAENKVADLEKKATDAHDALSETIDELDEDYLSQEGVEWQYGNPDELEEWQKQMNANLKLIYDAQDQLAIASDTTGKAIESAFSRVSLQTEFEDELKTIQETAGITGEKLKEMYDSSTDMSDTGLRAYIQSLLDCGVIANTSAEELQKVVDLSIELGGNASDAATANKKLARSQKMLQYYKQYKELNKYTQKLKDVKKGTASLTSEDKKRISTIRATMQALASEISAYDILGEQIDEAKQAFEDFEKAKESDENTDYLSTAGEMFQAVIDGYQSAEMGSETFKSAFKSLIPKDVYEDLDTLEERYDAAAEYISGTLSRYFKVEYDDDGAIESVETTTKNMQTFMEDAASKGLATFEKGQWQILETDFDKFASGMNMTTSALVAFGQQADKVDADWIMGDNSSFFDSFDMDTEANIYRATKALADLDQQLIDGEIGIDAYSASYREALLKYNTNVEEARSNVAKFVETQELYKEQQEKINNLLDEYKKKKNIGEDTSEIKKQIEEATKQLGEYGQKLESYGVTELSITVAKEQVENDIQEIEDKYQDFADKVEFDEESGKYQIKSGITFEEGSEDQQVLEKYVALLNEQYNLDVLLGDDTVDSYTVLQDISTTLQEISDLLSGVTAKKWVINVGANIAQGVKDFWNWLGGGGKASQEAGGGGSSGATSLNGNAHFNGVANASGTLGAEVTSTSLVGELGPELRVRGNRWELLGENGAEFADVKKGDIIFNHKQTEQLLKNGYVSGRGKAYAEGTNNTFASRVSRGNSIDYEKCIKLLSQYEKDVAQAAKESNDYIAKLDDRYKKYGNIDNVDRNIVLWNDENLNKYSAYIESMANLYDTSAKEFADDLAGSWSTVLGAADRFEFNGQSMEVAYSQMLNNGADTKLLTYEELENYMYDLMQRSMVNGSVDPNRMVELDSNGIVEDIQGEMVLVKDLLAGVEGQLVDGIKLSQEDIQTMAGNLTNSSSIYNGYSMHEIQENTLWKDAVANYGMGGSAFVELEAEAESYGLTLDELIAKTEAYRETTQEPLQQDVNIGATIDAEGIAQKIYSVFSNIFSTISSWFGNLFSGGNSEEEDGASHALGSSGLTNNETGSLVGELGTEMLVRNGKWQTIGENGAEMMNLKRGDIIFNHQQTEALLKHGFVNSRGKSFASGNAHVGTSGTIFTKYATVSGYGGKVPDWFGHSSILGDIADASDSVVDAADDAKQTIDFIEYRLEEIENSITNMTNRIENFIDDTSQTKEKNSLYEGLVDAEKQKASTYLAAAEAYNKKAAQLLSEVPSQYREMAKNGAIAIKDFVGDSESEIADAIEEYRTWSTKAEDAENSYLESIAEISAKRLEQLQDIADDFENIVGITEQHSSLIQAEMDLLDEAGERLSENFYKELMKDSQKQIADLNNKRASLQNILNQAVKSGDVRVGTDDWYEMVNAIYDVDDSILSCKKDLESFQNSINDLYWDNLDKLISRIDDVDSELSHLYNLVSDEEKVVDEFGNWTKDGVTALGLLAQQLEVANFKVEQYGEAIARLEKDYAAGLYSTDEYNEKLAELKENQWDAIEAQESAKKSIIDLNKTRVQAVKDGLQKEIDAYSELIDKKKDELSLQKEANDFAKQVAEQQKNIADIQKRLAVISGDNSASAIAQKKKLQAELKQAQDELNDLYYDHSIEKQQEALDKSLENYQDSKQDEMDALDESLKNEDQIIQDSYATIAANTESLAQNLTDIANKYGISLSDSVTKPWESGANAIGTYQEKLNAATSAFTDQLKLIKQELVDLQAEADKTANSIINATNSKKDKTEGAKYTPPKSNSQNNSSQTSKPKEPPSKGSSVTVKKSATNFSRNGGNGTHMQSWVPGSTFTVYQVSGSEVLIGRKGGYTGWVKLSDIEGYYAKGSKNIPHNQLAIIDELGEELVLHAGVDGRLQYLSKGSSVIPHDITSNLMKLGSLDPTQILERSTPSVDVPHITNNNIELNMEFGNLVHVDTVSNDTLPELQKMVRNEFDNCMKSLNNSLKRFCR